jgi:hypothetical protein
VNVATLRRLARLVSLSAATALAGCAAGAGFDSFEDVADAAADARARDAAPSGDGPRDAGREVAWSGVACSAETEFVYLLTTSRSLYRFWPPTQALEFVGRPDCPGADGVAPISMAIDQWASAWILYADAAVYRVDLASGACVPTGYDASGTQGPFLQFGMAFTADPSSPEGESLLLREALTYEAGHDPGYRMLGRFDTTSMKITPIGAGAGGNADLSGTRDGRLWGVVKGPDDALQVARLDPATGATLDTTTLGGETVGGAWAIAAWGGDVYLFVSAWGEHARILRYEPATGAHTVVRHSTLDFVGAGVSTCAPIVSPR